MAPRRKFFLVSLVILIAMVVLGMAYYARSSRPKALAEPDEEQPMLYAPSPAARANAPTEQGGTARPPRHPEPPGSEGGTPGHKPPNP